MPSTRELRDPIHGFVFRTETEAGLIDTKVFQRLRGISQLALARLVYPGAVHTRFDHSIGVMHVAGKLGRNLLDDSESELRKRVRVAALLHDIGHGPFSHVSESLLNAYADRDELDFRIDGTAQEEIHEHLTCRIIETSEEIPRWLSGAEREKLVDLLLGTAGDTLVKQIVSGPLDADKQDYLLRDSHFCGVKYGVFDIDRLINTLRVLERGVRRELAASEDGIHAIEQFVLAKYHMNTQVYRHKVRLATDAMIVRALQLGIEEDDLAWLEDIYSYDGSEEFIDNYLQWDDIRLMSRLLHPSEDEEGFASELFRRLRYRDLFKVVFSEPLLDFNDPVERSELFQTFKKLLWADDDKQEAREVAEERIAGYLSGSFGQDIRPEHVIIWSYQFKSVREQSRDDEGSIMIRRRGGQNEKFEEASTLFRSIDEKQKEMHIKVFAPFPVDNRTEKEEYRRQFQDEIHDLLIETMRNQDPDHEEGGDDAT